VRPGPDLAEIARGYGSLAEAGARQAFVHTLRAVIDPLGQRVSARDRLYLASEVPTLIMWGGRDPIIPVEHGRDASDLIPNCRFEVFKAAGHFPHLEEPRRFVRVLKKFVAETEPAEVEIDRVRERVLEEAGIDEDQIPGARRRRRGPRAIAAVGGR